MLKRLSHRRMGSILQYYGLLFAALPALLIGMGWTVGSIISYKTQSLAITSNFLDQQKTELLFRVREFEEFSSYVIKKNREEVLEEIRLGTEEADELGQHLYEDYKEQFPQGFIETIIIETLRSKHFLEGSGFYLVIDPRGKVLLSSDYPGIEGQNLKDLDSLAGEDFLEKLNNTGKRKGGGYLQHPWQAPHSPDSDNFKISYAKRFTPYDWLILTGEYKQKIEDLTKLSLVERMEDIAQENQGYIFSFDAQERLLFYPVSGAAGKTRDAFLKEMNYKEIEKIPQEGQGIFLRYSWDHPQRGREIRMDYLHAMENWGWVVGTSANLSSMESYVKQEKAELIKSTVIQLISSLLVLGLSLSGVALVIRRVVKKLVEQLAYIEEGVAGAALGLTPIDASPLNVDELGHIAEKINQLLANRRVIEQDLKWHDIVVSHTGEAVVVTGAEGDILTLNQAAETITGYAREEVTGKSYFSFFHEDREGLLTLTRKKIQEEGHWRGEIPLKQKKGPIIPVEADITAVQEEKGEKLSHFVVIFRDISERKNWETALMRKLDEDDLTGIANRRGFNQAIEAIAVDPVHSLRPLALLMIDIDHFKIYNDSFGHLAGDECLRRIAKILEEELRRRNERVFRYGGEEFSVLLPNRNLASAIKVGFRLRDAVRRAQILHGPESGSRWVTISVGIASAVLKETSPKQLIQVADEGLYMAKKSGRDHVKVASFPGKNKV